jgi:ADP-ribose pyrophosphatase
VNFEWTGSENGWQGKILRTTVERYRFDDGTEVTREKIWHPGAVGIVPLDDDHIWLTRQPREVVGAVASLEIPAGKLDIPGESPLAAGKRELAEEIGKQADRWEEIVSFYTSPGSSNERVWLFLATGLSDCPPGHVAPPDEEERIEVVPWRLDRLDDAIAECDDSKSLIALYWLLARGRP